MAARQRFRSILKVGAVTTDWSRSVMDPRGMPAMGGAGHARIGQVAHLSKHYWVVGRLHPNQRSFGVTTWGDATHFDCSAIVLQRYMETFALDRVERARADGVVIVNDVDDWFWGLHPKNAAYAATDPRRSPNSNVDIYKKILSLSSVIVTSTDFLTDQINNWWNNGPRVITIPNGVDVKSFYERRHYSGRVVVGWAGSTAHRSGDLAILRKPFGELDEVTFFHLGDHPSHPSFATEVGCSPKLLKTLPMLAPHEYPAGLKFDIGVVPLVDIPFNHAKSNIKGLEYAAAGIPFVASPLPEYVKLSEEWGIGRLAKTSADWKRQLRALFDYDTRVAEARRQREAVVALSAKQQARAWDELIWELA